MRPESDAERELRHEASIRAYRGLVDPAAPPTKPYVIEHHFHAGDDADVTGLMQVIQDRGFHVDTFAYDPDNTERAWTVVAVKLDLLEERRILALSDEMEAAARAKDAVYDGWLTRVDG